MDLDALAVRIADALEGTAALSVAEQYILEHYEDETEPLSDEDFQRLVAAVEDRVEICEGCDWWVEAGEVDEDGNCWDCQR